MTGHFSLSLLVNLLPRSTVIHRLCRRYVNYYNGDNNCDIRSNGEWRWMKEVIPECTTVFDVGANIGDWTDMALHFNRLLTVHCFEPCSTTFDQLQKRNFGQGVILNQSALGDHSGEAPIHIFDECSGTNSLYRRQGLGAVQKQTEIIRVDTIDAYCQRNDIGQIDLLKIDVEGHELMALKGGTGMLGEGRIKRIQFEYGGTFIDASIWLKDMFEFLKAYGFLLYKVYPDEIRHIDRYRQELETFQQSNWVALC